MAKNDWIVAGLNNPDFTNADFSNIADMTVDNTQLLSRDEYLKSDFIKQNPMFRDPNTGNFSEQKFTEYYKKRVQDFGEFQQGDYYQGPALDMFDIDRTKDTPVQDIKFNISRGVNPDRQAIGIEGVNVYSDPVFSKREIAKQNRVFDTATGRFLDYTVNEHTLVSSPLEWLKDQFRDPLVLATWDEDGEHIDPITGVVRQHRKGEHKLNDKGTYYYETLGGRSVIGKDVLSVFDTFTVDGQGINKYDFFDSNDMEKSVAGTIAKNVVTLLPLFCGPVVGTIYAGTLVAREFSKSLPMLYGMATAFSDSESPSWINNLAALGERMSGSTSDYAQQNTFAFENFGNLVSDVALQWGQQKFVAQAFTKLKGTPNYIADAERNAKALYDAKKVTMGESAELWQVCLNKYMPKAQELATKSGQLGRDLSLAYMAIISNTDVYASALEHGTTKKEAAAIALGSTLGMFAVDKYLHLGEIFFDEATPDATKLARQALRNEFRQAQSAFSAIHASEAPARNKFLQYITKGAEVGKRVFNKFGEDLKYHTLSMTGKMVGEGLEEVSEELVADMSKTLYELAGEFGFDTSVKDVGAWDNAFERYAMSFLGGAVGGGVFYGKEVWDGKKFHKPKLDEDIATLIRNGHVDDLRNQLTVMHQEGKTGSKALSATEYEIGTDGKAVWRTTDNVQNSQAQAVADLVLDRINSIEEVLLANRVGLSDDELFDNMVLSEKRYNRYKSIAAITNYYNDFATELNKLVNAELALKAANNTMEGTPDGTAIPNDTALNHLTQQQKDARDQNLEALRQNVENQRTNIQDFLSGNTSLDYTRKLNFAMDPALHTPFLEVDMEEYLQSKYPGKTLEQLTPEEQINFIAKEWPEYIQTQLKSKLSDAWAKFKTLEGVVNPHLGAMEQETPAYKAWLQNMENLFTNGSLSTEALLQSYKTFNDKLDNETDDEYDNRHTRLVDPVTGDVESDVDFLNRRLDRLRKIDAYNEQQEQAWVDQIDAELQKVGYKVDPMMARTLKQILPQSGRLKQVLLRKIHQTALSPEVRTVLGTLDTDLSNLDEVKTGLRDSMKVNITTAINNVLEGMAVNLVTDDTGAESTLGEFLEATIGPDFGDYTLNDIKNDQSLLDGLSDESRQAVLDSISALESTGATTVLDFTLGDINNGTVSAEMLVDLDQTVDNQFNPLLNTINNVVSNYQNNPLVKLQNKLKASIVNPVAVLLKNIAASNGDTLADVEDILDTIQDTYDNLEDAAQLILDDTQRENLEKAKHYMDLLKVYMYAASTVPTMTDPVGHNRTANKFAQTHSDKLRAPWAKLPEIDADYATLYMRTLDSYSSEIDAWISMSDSNQVNKIRKFVETDRAFSKTLWGVLSAITRNFTVNGKNYDLLEGFDSIDQTHLNTDLAQVPLYNLERLLHKNIANIAADQNMTVSELVQNSNLLETLIQGLSQLDNKKNSQITAAITPDKFSDFDKLQYLATLIAVDPAIFYKQLQQRVSTNQNIAPITVQEFDARIAQASMSQTFRDIISYAHSKLANQETPLLSNTTLLFGVAGAGKTQVILNSIDAAIKDKPVFIAGPTESQAQAMQRAMGRDKSLTFKDLLVTILGKDQWQKIEAEINSATKDPNWKGTYFSVTDGQDGLRKVKLNLNNIQFQQLTEKPAAIYLDEATHLSTVEAQLIDAYAKSVGAQVFMCGDPAQRGYSNPNNGIQNIDEGAVWAAKAPKLTISLRDNNLQKFQNQEAVKTLLDQVMDKRLNASDADYEGFFTTAENIAKKFNFRLFNGDELNGDMITQGLDDATMSKIKAAMDAGKSVAFIGDQGSAHLAKLRNAGVNISADNVFNLNQMQGQEFDLVVIDQQFTAPQDMTQMRIFLHDLYTLMTRAREASVFIDNGLSAIIGKNVPSPNKSKAPSILSGVDELRRKKLDILSQLDFSPLATAANQQQNPQGQPQGQQNGQNTPPPPANPDLDFTDPETRQDPVDVEAIIDAIAEDDSGNLDNGGAELSTEGTDIGSFLVECYGDATYLGLEEGPKQKFTTSDGRVVEANPWEVVMPSSPDAELRNLQAIAPGEKVWKYADKIELQKKLYKLKAAILFDHSWPTRTNTQSLPSFIVNNFNQSDWENGTFEIEFRGVSSNDTQPVWGRFRRSGDAGFEYGGVRLIANIVFKVKNKKGQICKIDLAGINSPKTLLDNSSVIKTKLQEKINNPNTLPSTKAKLQGLLNSWDTDAQHYKNWFDARIDDFVQNGYFSMDVTRAVRKNKTTIFRKRAKNNPIRLGGNINPDNIDIDSDIHNLIEMNPDKVFSPIYTFTGNDADFLSLDQSLAGKAVIFVSSDTLMDPKDLINQYVQQKKYPDQNTPKVRMIVLNTYGVTFHQMLDPEFIKRMQNGDRDKVPFRKNFMGIRMFTSLWNTRASLLQFTKALNDWKAANNYNDAQVQALTYAQHMKFQGKSDAEVERHLQASGLTLAALDSLTKFNEETCKDIPTYRLGYTENGNGFHVQKFNVKGSTAYSTDEANLLVITQEKAKQFLDMVSAVIKPICPGKNASGLVASQTLGLSLMKTNPDGTRTEWEPDELIDLAQATHRRSLSGLLSKPKDSKQILITDPNTGQELAFAEGDYWSVIPHLLSNFARTVAHFQYEAQSGPLNPNKLYAHVTFVSDDTTGTRTKIDISIEDFFGQNGQGGYLKTANGQIDHSLSHMFDLIFHGSIEDIHATNKPQQLTDAYFTHGFDIHPEITRSKNGAGAIDIKGFANSDGEMLFYEIGTPEFYFESDVDILSAGMQLSLSELLALDPYGQPTQPTTQPGPQVNPDPFDTVEPVIPREYQTMIDQLTQISALDDDFVYSEDTVDDLIDLFNEKAEDHVWTALQINAGVAMDYTFRFENGRFVTFKQWLEQKYPGALITADPVLNEIRFSHNGVDYKVDAVTQTIKPITTPAPRVEQESTTETVDRFTKSHGTGTVESAITDILNGEALIDKVIEYAETTPEDAQERVDEFASQLERIINNSKQETATQDSVNTDLRNLLDSADEMVIAAINELDEELYNKIFNDC